MIFDIINFIGSKQNRASLSYFIKPGTSGINSLRKQEHVSIMKEASFAALPPSSQPKLDGLSNKITVLFDIATQLSAHPEDALPGVISGPKNTDGLFINAFGALKTESDLEMEADLIDLVTIYWTDKIVTTASLVVPL